MLFVLSLYVAALVAVGVGVAARIKSRPGYAWFARRAGAISFLLAFLLLVLSSHGAYDSNRFEVVIAGPLGVLGLIAWLLGMIPGHARELPLLAAVSLGCAVVAVALIRHDEDYRHRRDALFAGAKGGNASEVRRLLATGLSPDLRDQADWPLLEMAANAETAQSLFDAGAKIAKGSCPLAGAARHHHDILLVKTLLAHGADPNCTDNRNTPARHAWWNQDMEMLEVLRRAGAKDAAEFERVTGALLKAVKAGDETAVKALLAGEYVRAECSEGLRLAAQRGDTSIALLLAWKTDAYREVGEAMLMAAENNRPATFESLIDELERRGPRFEGREMKAKALAIARKQGFTDIERIALARGAESQPPR